MSTPDEGTRFKDLWAWADEDGDEATIPPVDPAHVVAVLVARDCASWLPDQLVALESSHQRPATIVAVDVGSQDATPTLLHDAVVDGIIDRIVTVARNTTFADAVAAGVGDEEVPWLWILHDDSVPTEMALDELLIVASTADVVFPKLVSPSGEGPSIIQECGQSITKGGHRVGASEEGDIDQRQIEPGAVLGGSTAGMLVRGDTWRELGGLAPELPGRRDGVDFGWRANLAGWRVVRAPLASLEHRRATERGERPSDEHPHHDDRLAALRIVAARGAGKARLRFGTWARALGFLLAKSPSHAAAELRAHRRFRATPELTQALAARIPEGDETMVEDLLAPKHWVLRDGLDRLGSAMMDRYREFATDTTLDDLTSDGFGGPHSREQSRVAPGLFLVLAFLIGGVAAGWRLWGGLDLSGGGLLPAPETLTAAWDGYFVDRLPALGIAATVGTILFGQIRFLGFVLVLLGPLLAALAADSLLRHLGLRAGISAVGAAIWAAAVLVLGLPSAGDVTGIVVAITGPLVAKSVYDILTDESVGAERLRAPAVGAFWLFITAAFWPPALALATLGALVLPLSKRGTLAQWAVLVVPVWLLFAPWLVQLFRVPGRWLTGVDPLAWPSFPPSSYALMVGRIVPSGVPVWLSVAFFVVLALAAIWGLLRIPQAGRRWAVTALIAVPLLVGAGLSRLALDVNGGQARALLTVWALLVVAGMIAAIVLAERPRAQEHRRAVGVVAAGLVAALAAGAWPFVGMNGPVSTQAAALPGYVRTVVDSPRASRALLITKDDDTLEWNVVDARRPQWGSAERHPAGAFSAEFEEVVQAFSGGNAPDDLAERLRKLAVSHVWLSGFSPDEIVAISNVEGVTSAPASDTSTVFTVVGLVSRASIVDGGEETPIVDGKIPAGGAGRTLVIADADVVEASVGGRALERIDGELPTFKLGEASGELEFGVPSAWPSVWWSIAVLAALALLALPTLQGIDRRHRKQATR